MGYPQKIGIGGAVFLLVSIGIGWYGFPALVSMKINKSVGLKKGNDMRGMWTKSPIALEFKVYMFNITNPMEVMKGANPIVREVGPFLYYEWKTKVNLEDHPDEDTVSFNMKNTFYFNETLSVPLTGNETVTILNAALMSMVYTVEREKPGAVSLIAKAIPHLFNQPESPFVTAKVKDLLFDGVPINCTSRDFATSAICTQIRSDPKGLVKVNDDLFLFSFFGAKNGTADEHKLEVKRGVLEPQEVGLVVKVDDSEKLNIWAGDPCNTPKGTDSTIFPPFLTPQKDIVAYSTDICRSIAAKFQKPVIYKGIPGLRYTASFGDMSTEEDLKCFCPAPDKCLKRGLFDITKCAGAPLVVSLPHLYDVHEDYQRMVQGLSPDKDKHEIYMNFESMTATPLGARKRLQFNMFTHPIPKVPILKEMATTLIPIFWVEEGVELGDDFINMLDSQLFRTLRIAAVGKWIAIGLGMLVIFASVGLHFYNRHSFAVTPSAQAAHNKHSEKPRIDED